MICLQSEKNEVIIVNLENAKNMFKQYKTKDGHVVTLFHKDKSVEQWNAKKALSQLLEEFPDLSSEEVLR